MAVTEAGEVRARAAALVADLVHLLALAAYFPAQNARFVEAAERTLGRLRASSAPTVCVEARPGGLHVDGQPLDLAAAAAEQLHGTFDALGIARVEIARQSTAADLHAFAGVLRRAEREGAGNRFQQVQLRDLPPAVRVRFREFGRKGRGEANEEVHGDAVRHALEDALDAFGRDDRGLFTEVAAQAVRRGFASIVERLEVDAAPTARPPEASARPLEDVLALGVDAIRDALVGELGKRAGARALATLFQSAARALALSEDAPSASLVLEVLQQAAQKEAASPARRRPAESTEDAAARPSLAELRSRLEELSAGADVEQPLLVRDGAEQIGILLQLLLRRPEPRVLHGISERLGRSLAHALTPDEQRTVAAGVRELFVEGDAALADRALPPVTAALRRQRPSAPAAMLADACEGNPQAALEVAWPHLAHELLFGLGDRLPDVESRLAAAVAALPGDRLQEGVARLARLPGFDLGRLGCAAFDPPRAELLPLLGELMLLPRGGSIADRLLRALRATPPAWLPADALAALDEGNPALRPLVESIVREGALVRASVGLRRHVSELVVRELEALPPERRREPWVPGAIEAAGLLGGRDAVGFLRAVRGARRFLVVPVWPSECRRAASEALPAAASGAAGEELVRP